MWLLKLDKNLPYTFILLCGEGTSGLGTQLLDRFFFPLAPLYRQLYFPALLVLGLAVWLALSNEIMWKGQCASSEPWPSEAVYVSAHLLVSLSLSHEKHNLATPRRMRAAWRRTSWSSPRSENLQSSHRPVRNSEWSLFSGRFAMLCYTAIVSQYGVFGCSRSADMTNWGKRHWPHN